MAKKTHTDATPVEGTYYLRMNHAVYIQEASGNIVKYGTDRTYAFTDVKAAKELIAEGNAVRTDADGNTLSEY